MLPLSKTDIKPAKCRFTHGYLPGFVDEKQTPRTRKPFASVHSFKWLQTVDLLLPEPAADTVKSVLGNEHYRLRYAKVMMSLSDIIEGDFFTRYIKTGNVLMLSEGRPRVDNVYSLHEGILRLEIDRPTYERAGLEGKPIPDGGSKHKANRYAIEINLRLPSMLHGKKGFERIKWAFKNVLNESSVWLFFDQAVTTTQSENVPLDKHHPLWVTCKPHFSTLPSVIVPNILHVSSSSTSSLEIVKDGEQMADLEEWISLVALQSPRVTSADRIDSYLSRYAPPTEASENGHNHTSFQEASITRIRWSGFLPSSFVLKIFLLIKKSCRSDWAALQLHGFQGDMLTLLKMTPGSTLEEYMEWEHW